MDIGHRSRLSLCQLMDAVLSRDECSVIFRKYGISTDDIDGYHTGYSLLRAITDAILAAAPSQVWELAQELARTRQSIRHTVSPKSLFDERWDDFTLCMKLDGIGLVVDDYGREIGPFVPIEPTIEGSPPVEDDLSRELRLSQLPASGEVLRLIEDSAKAFLSGDNNGCLNNARVALETTEKSIAREMLPPDTTVSSKWGEVLVALREAGFISQDQEKGLAGVYRFVSPGSHVPVGFTESEFARLGRTLALSCTYFLVKEWNGTRRRDS
ncbi:hypothetical protein E0H51_31625 [Rhizobium leguminosarum bv. viciae]|uniref:hypothetical protein n=1 Tax=Rhizobium leguminosarum TaxID=384 RepID=UPI00103EB2EE|nr:hypothetical protein [Rhizobium leguminosarum]TBY68960.1 hypothetical protein E0H51_31625 [Rhizobium leguminosarum bv. viciae]